MDHNGATYIKLQYHQTRFSFTKAILIYTLLPQLVCDHAHVSPIIFIYAHITIEYHAFQCDAKLSVSFWMWGRDQLKTCWRFTIKLSCIYESRVYLCGNAHGIESTAEVSMWEDSILTDSIYSIYKGRQDGDDSKRGYEVHVFRYFSSFGPLLSDSDMTGREGILQIAWIWHLQRVWTQCAKHVWCSGSLFKAL